MLKRIMACAVRNIQMVIIGAVYFLLYRKFLLSFSLFGSETADDLFILGASNIMTIIVMRIVGYNKDIKLWSIKTMVYIIIGTLISFAVFLCSCLIYFAIAMYDLS